jgi:hypothetical protein
MSRQFWEELLAWATSDGTSVANLTTETIIFPNVSIPANYMQDGRVLRVTAYGRYSTTTATSPTLRFRVRWAAPPTGATLFDSGTMTSATGITTALWKVEVVIQTRSNGATGTMFAMGDAVLGSGVAPVVGSVTGLPAFALGGSGGVVAPAVGTSTDLTAETPLCLTAQWSVAQSTNTLTGHIYIVEGMN